jgi:peptidyl-prolyl cis-trans isomerase-like 4
LEKKRQYKAADYSGSGRRDRYGMVYDEEELRRRHERDGKYDSEKRERSRSRSPQRDRRREYHDRGDRRGRGDDSYKGQGDRDRADKVPSDRDRRDRDHYDDRDMDKGRGGRDDDNYRRR